MPQFCDWADVRIPRVLASQSSLLLLLLLLLWLLEILGPLGMDWLLEIVRPLGVYRLSRAAGLMEKLLFPPSDIEEGRWLPK